MRMHMKEAALILMAGRKAAHRMGQEFVLDRDKMACLGFDASEITEIEAAVNDIERFTDERLAKLHRTH